MGHLWRQSDGGKLDLDLHLGQKACWESARRFVFFISGTQGGKTSFGPWWLWREIYGADNWPGRGPGDYLAVTATYDLFKLKMLPELRNVFEHILRPGGVPLGRYWSGDKVMELRPPDGPFMAKTASDAMWGRVILRSAESDGGLESSSALAAWLDECGQDSFSVDTLDAVRRRLSLSRGRILGTTTPYNLGYLKTEIVDRWHAGDPDIHVVTMPSTANPSFPQSEFDDARSRMPDWKFRMFYMGELTRPAGLIYQDYRDWPRHEIREDEPGNMVADFPIPPEWPRLVGVDFGATNTATVWLAHDRAANVFYAYLESLEGDRTTGEHGTLFKQRAAGTNLSLVFGGAPGETQQRRDWAMAGVPIQQPPVADVEAGIGDVIALLRTGRLFVFESLRGLRSELGSYARVVDANGQVTEKIKNKETYHRLDALRYVCQWPVRRLSHRAGEGESEVLFA